MRGGAVLLRKQSDIVAQAQQSFEQRPRLIAAVLKYISVGEPKAAGKKGAFAGRQAIGAPFRAPVSTAASLPVS